MIRPITLAHPDEILRVIADFMAELGVGVIPVVERDRLDQLVGLITHFDVPQARRKLFEEERQAERVLSIHRVTRVWSPDPSRFSPDEENETP